MLVYVVYGCACVYVSMLAAADHFKVDTHNPSGDNVELCMLLRLPLLLLLLVRVCV